MSSKQLLSLLSAMMIAAFWSAPANGQYVLDEGPPEFSLGMGYAHIGLGSDSSLDSEDAFHMEPALTLSPIRQLPQLRIGGDVAFSMVLDNSSRTIISKNGALIITGSSDIPLWLLEPELRVSWRQPLGSDHQFFIEPGVAGGVAFGFLSLTSEDGHSYDADASTLFGRVFLRAGAEVPGGTAGIEASYLAGGTMNFGGNASGDLNEFYIGIFGALSF